MKKNKEDDQDAEIEDYLPADFEKLDPESFAEVYDTLKVIARHHVMGNSGVETLNPTALVHEVYLKMYTSNEKNWTSQSHFYRIAAKATRQIITDYARRKLSKKRTHDTTDSEMFAPKAQMPLQSIMFLDKAIATVEAENKQHAALLELKLFGGFTSDEIAQMLSVSRSTVEREWKIAKRRITRIVGEDEQ